MQSLASADTYLHQSAKLAQEAIVAIATETTDDVRLAIATQLVGKFGSPRFDVSLWLYGGAGRCSVECRCNNAARHVIWRGRVPYYTLTSVRCE